MSIKTVVITGGNRGLGAGLAKFFAKKGCNVASCSTSNLQDQLSEKSLHYQANVSNQEEVSLFAKEVETRFGVIDIWINNAGILKPVQPIRDLKAMDLQANLDVNLFGVLFGAQEFLAHLERFQRRRGCLINISSGAARFGIVNWGSYCIAKAGVDRLSDCVKIENPWLNVHSLAPGIIDTDMQKYIRNLDDEKFPDVQKFRNFSPSDFNSPDKVGSHIWNLARAQSQAEPVCLDIR